MEHGGFNTHVLLQDYIFVRAANHNVTYHMAERTLASVDCAPGCPVCLATMPIVRPITF